MTAPVPSAPVYADAPALDLANTVYISRGRNLDGLLGPEDLHTWTSKVAPQLDITSSSEWLESLTADAGDVERFRELRGAIRSVAADVVTGRAPQTGDLDILNEAAAIAPRRPVLRVAADGRLHKEAVADAPGMHTVLSALAEDAIDLFGGERRHQLRACQAPNCPLFFLKDHARREWCGPTCGNRVRAARAYRKRIAAAAAD